MEQFAKADFPTARVYGPTNEATLRLVTCGGRYDMRRQSYVDKIVVFVFATMTNFRPPQESGEQGQTGGGVMT